jgi:prepilin-type processing-associated H-X9-DG protein
MEMPNSDCEGIYFIPDEPARGLRGAALRRIARWVIVAGIGGLAAVFMAAGIAAQVRQYRREQCHANLKQLSLAFQQYHDAHSHYPAPALVKNEGAPLLSWRVALLPHLGYKALYEKFHLDEPWDSPHNRSLLTAMPPEFACPGSNGYPDGRTGYLVVVGPEIDPWSVNTVFHNKRGVEIREITDGTSTTVVVVETLALVPWTKPDDLHWSPGGPLPQLKSPHEGGAHALFVDGSILFLKNTIIPASLLALLTINGGEVLGGG